ncbi:MAG: fumarylacetoacetate hydrolase family protein [Rhodoferax sp.]|nr:fumarylacetoacetate hydrolase family protein [Rhodoferax sp.]
MKFASYQDGSRDGQLVVVSRDLSQAVYPSHIANRLQQVLDDWNYLSPQLQDLSDQLNAGRARHAFAFNPAQCLAPLPRAYQWVHGGGFGSHAEVLQQAQAVDAHSALCAIPPEVQASSDHLLGAQAPVVCANEAWELDFSAELAVATSDIPMGCTPERALDGVRLLLLANSLQLRAHGNADAGTAFAPVAVTPDELGDAWRKGRVNLALQTSWNGRKVGLCDAGADMTLHFGQLIAHWAQHRPLRAGSLVGSGTVSCPARVKDGKKTAQDLPEWPKGYHCIAEKRAMEVLQNGQTTTGYLRVGDTVDMDVKGRDGHSLFGAIAQEVVAPGGTLSA